MQKEVVGVTTQKTLYQRILLYYQDTARDRTRGGSLYTEVFPATGPRPRKCLMEERECFGPFMLKEQDR